MMKNDSCQACISRKRKDADYDGKKSMDNLEKSLDSIIENRKREEEQIAGFGIEFRAEIFQ